MFTNNIALVFLAVPIVWLRKYKSCQNHLQMHIWSPNYVLLTVRTENHEKISLTSYAWGYPNWLFYNVKIAKKVPN